MKPPIATERTVVDLAEWIGAFAAGYTGLNDTKENTVKILERYLPHPDKFIDGPASLVDLRKFFLATLKGAVRMMEEYKP